MVPTAWVNEWMEWVDDPTVEERIAGPGTRMRPRPSASLMFLRVLFAVVFARFAGA